MIGGDDLLLHVGYQADHQFTLDFINERIIYRFIMPSTHFNDEIKMPEMNIIRQNYIEMIRRSRNYKYYMALLSFINEKPLVRYAQRGDDADK